MSKHLHVFIKQRFVAGGGETKNNYTKVGVVFPHEKGGGFTINITKGISVSGELVVFPPKAKTDG
jgi:hypothetical protein